MLPQLQSFKVMIDNDPTHLSLSHDLSRISALHTIELRKSFTATHYAPVVCESIICLGITVIVHLCLLLSAPESTTFPPPFTIAKQAIINSELACGSCGGGLFDKLEVIDDGV